MAASILASERLGAELFVKSYDVDPGTASAALAAPDGVTTPIYLDMRDYLRAGVMVRPTIVGGAGITLVRVFASTDIAGATSATLIKTSGTVAGDSLNDVIWLEWTADEIAGLAAGLALRYITVEITTGTSTDESNLTFVAVPKAPRTGLTATAIT
jgi:hypothetical protein